MNLDHPSIRNMSEIEKSEAQMRVAMESPNHLKEWLLASGRQWIVLDSLELVDALSWPEGVEALIQILAAYRDHRATISSGEVETQKHPDTGEEIRVPLMKGEVLGLEERKRATQSMVVEIRKEEPTWSF
jgi:hypothetical protein